MKRADRGMADKKVLVGIIAALLVAVAVLAAVVVFMARGGKPTGPKIPPKKPAVVKVPVKSMPKQKEPATGIHPMIDSNECVIGGLLEGSWVEYESIANQVKGGEKYKFYSMDGYLGEGQGGVATEEPDGFHIKTAPSFIGSKAAVGIVADWNLQPRKTVRIGSSQAEYTAMAADILKEKGMDASKLHVRQIVKTDLEGDGAEEVFIVATIYRKEYPTAEVHPGDYSFVAIRRFVGGEAKTTVLEGDFYPKQSDENPMMYGVSGLFDLDGDGFLEILIDYKYYEGYGKVIYDLRGGELKNVLSGGCGL